MKTIAANIKDWPRQWKRKKSLRAESTLPADPRWKLSAESLERIEVRSSVPPDRILPANLDVRIVICELLNSFRQLFSNPLEMYSSIKFGIRPLLYSILGVNFYSLVVLLTVRMRSAEISSTSKNPASTHLSWDFVTTTGRLHHGNVADCAS